METQPFTPVSGADNLRDFLKNNENCARDFISNLKAFPEQEGIDKGECIAQAMLALRHLEDARMRFGKVIQYAEGGVSKYDQPQPTQA